MNHALRGAAQFRRPGQTGTRAGTVVDPITRKVRVATKHSNGSITYRAMGSTRCADKATHATWRTA